MTYWSVSNVDAAQARLPLSNINVNKITTPKFPPLFFIHSTPAAAKDYRQQSIWVMGTHLQADQGTLQNAAEQSDQ